MMIPKNKPIRDPAYLKSFRDAACYACGAQDGTVVAAHIRHGLAGGMGLKPGDDLTLPLCGGCHEIQGRGEVNFWTRGCPDDIKLTFMQRIKDKARARYNDWKGKK